MTEEQKNKLRNFFIETDGIEKVEEIIESLEYMNDEYNDFDPKIKNYINWIEDKLNFYLSETSDLIFLIGKQHKEILSLITSLFFSVILNVVLLMVLLK
jgi:predicted PurR-regulated permease PerM